MDFPLTGAGFFDSRNKTSVFYLLHMNLLDLGIIIVLGLVGLRGYYRGLFQEVSVIVGLLGGLVAAAHYYLELASYLSRWLTTPLYARIAAFFVILIVVYWATRALGYFLARLLHMVYLGALDRLLGGVFALAKGVLILGFLVSISPLVVPKDSRLLIESKTAPYLKNCYEQALVLLPPEFKDQVKERVRQFEKGWDRRRGEGAPAKEI